MSGQMRIGNTTSFRASLGVPTRRPDPRDPRRGALRHPDVPASFLPLGLLVTVLISACATPGKEENRPLPPRPEYCELQEVGPIRVPARYRSGVRESLYETIHRMGYDRITDVREITEVLRSRSGVLQERLVGWEGMAWRWNDPACRRGEYQEEQDPSGV